MAAFMSVLILRICYHLFLFSSLWLFIFVAIVSVGLFMAWHGMTVMQSSMFDEQMPCLQRKITGETILCDCGFEYTQTHRPTDEMRKHCRITTMQTEKH